MLEKWIEFHARLQPGKVAVHDGRRSYSYRDLSRRVRKASRYLRESLGLRKGDRVAILSQNCIAYLDLFFGCAHSGFIFAPLNYRLSPQELEYQVKDSAPEILLYSSQFQEMAGKLVENARTLKSLDLAQYERVVQATEDRQTERETDWEDPLCILYTGGTTGTPKGAVLSQRMILWNALNTCTSWALTPEEIAPIFTPMFHTGGLNVLLTPLLSIGGTVVIPDYFDPDLALKIIEGYRCTVVFMVPTMFQMISDSPSFPTADLSSVRFMISGGAPCPESLFRAYGERGVTFIQGYGLTEAGPNNFTFPHERASEKAGTIGIPSLHARIRLEPDSGRVGEIWIKGPHLFSHYWRRPEETERAFQDGWLKTGDLASIDEDGFYRIMGRRKEMFISGGENVYPVEVESAISFHPLVKEVAVVGVKDSKWGEVGKAFVVPRNNGDLTEKPRLERVLVDHLRERLARYKIPRHWEFRPDLPKSPAGKVLKHALP